MNHSQKISYGLFLIGALSLFPFMSVQANEQEMTCPEFIQAESEPVKLSVVGWDVSSRSDRLWNDGGFISSGDPEARGDLMGEDTEKHGEKGTRWKLDDDDNPRGVWFPVVMVNGMYCFPER